MLNPNKIEEIYQRYVQDLSQWVHDGLVAVDLNLLHDLGLLETLHDDKDQDDFTQYFHVVETPEKVTLFN